MHGPRGSAADCTGSGVKACLLQVLTNLTEVMQMFHKSPPQPVVVDPVPQTFMALAKGSRLPLVRWLLSRVSSQYVPRGRHQTLMQAASS